ncbi:MAG TPA: type VI secretion system tip protein TssI/VgrG [Polyangiaceae bacterium]
MGPEATKVQFRLEGGPVPPDAAVVGYQAFEALSRPFEVDVDFYTTDAGFDIDSCVKQALLLVVVDDDGETRPYHGVVERAEFVKVRYHLGAQRFYFRVHLVPALAALAFRENCRIFQDKSIVDVIATLFDEAGFTANVVWQLKNTYPKREFIVQYRESSLNFVSRLLEDEGIFYFFQHAPAGHTLILADTEDAFVLMDAAGVEFSMGHGIMTAAEPLERFARTRTLRTTSVRLRDYDFEKPQVKPEGTQVKADAWPMAYYEYPGGFTKSADGNRRATARMRELRSEVDVCRGNSGAVGLRVGAPFMVGDAAEGCLNGEFVVTSLVSRGSIGLHYEVQAEEEGIACQNEFTAIPKGSPYAPPRRARKPRIRGVQTVLVTGPSTSSDQTIHTDKYGRIKVHFFWDRVGQLDENASCWLRTNQAMMGGTMVLPRVGWELSVAFLEGDPDRPFTIGRLYNGENTPPYALPGAKASGSVKSMSSPGGAGHNEMKMSDSGGSQGHGMSAQKDMNSVIGNNKTENIAVDENHSVKVNMAASIGGNETLTVGGNQAVDIGAVLSEKIGGNQVVVVGGADTTNCDSNLVEHITGTRSYTISAMSFTMQNGIEHTVTGDLSRDVSAVQLNGSVGSISDNILGNLDEKCTLAKVILAKGSVGETVTGNKSQTAAAAEVHLIKGSYQAACDDAVKRLIGGVHQWKAGGDISLKGKNVKIVGVTGTLSAGGSSIKLGGGPVVITGSKVTSEAPIIKYTGGTMKLGPG